MPTTPDAPNYLTVQEAADLLRVTPRTIRNRITDGLLPAKKIAGSRKVLLIDQRDVLGLLTDAKPEDAAQASEDAQEQD
jgi:excisionase family DNA binding protein